MAKTRPNDAAAAWRRLEAIRWPDGIQCPHCGRSGRFWHVARGRRYRQCGHCQTQFSATYGTPLAGSRTPLSVWFAAFSLVGLAKGEISPATFRDRLRITYKAALSMRRRLQQFKTVSPELYRALVGHDGRGLNIRA